MEHHGAEPVGSIRAGLGEGPVWDAAGDRLLWIDIRAARLHATRIDTQETTVRDLPGAPGCIALTEGGALLVAIGQELLALSEAGDVRPVASLPAGAAGRFNDGKPDAQGRFWVGTATAEGQAACDLWRFDPGAGFSVEVPGIAMSNGLGWSPDGRRFHYVDSLTGRLDLFDHDPLTGRLSGRRPLHSLPEGHLPDGLCVDAEGDIWLAVWGGAAVLHLSRAGALLGQVDLPTPLVTSCAFGGPDLATLFITTADEDGADPHAGRLFAADVGRRGLPPGRARLG